MKVFGYTYSGEIVAEINGVFVTVPDDPENLERKIISKWENKGNKIPEVYKPEVPEIIDEEEND